MKTYDEKTGLEIESPDLEAGCVYLGCKKTPTRCGCWNAPWRTTV